ncbi:MAG: hypothetical protein ACODAE_10720, partial [Gemmatimonadota bacterium]
PQTPVVVAVDVHRADLLANTRDGDDRAVRRRFLDRATNEERFAAEYVLLARGMPRASSAAARTALWTAVALRPYAQEAVWFPGFGGPSVRALERRFGLGAVEFDDDVPAAWRPYFRRMLASALEDMHRVMPALDLDGLQIRFGRDRERPASLAMHDPGRRRVYLPPATGAGTIAHEIAHDLDWQIALRQYRVRGDYGTDRAARLHGGRLAAAIGRLTTAPLEPPAPGSLEAPNHPRRPAEIFARSVDWFVTVALAEQGRMNGHLSSVQDDVLTGYGTVRPPDVSGESGAALIEILDAVAPVYPATRSAFLDRYGPTRSPSAYDLVRRIALDPEAPPIERSRLDATARFDAVRLAREATLATIEPWGCGAPGAATDLEAGETRRHRLVDAAAAARARGTAVEIAGDVAGRTGRRWVAHLLYDSPAPERRLDSSSMELLHELAAAAGGTRGPAAVAPPSGHRLGFDALAQWCSGRSSIGSIAVGSGSRTE